VKNAAFLFDKYNDNKVFSEKNRDFFLDRCLICVIRMKSPGKKINHNLGLQLFSIPPKIDIFAINHGYPFAHFFLNNPEVMLIFGRNK